MVGWLLVRLVDGALIGRACLSRWKWDGSQRSTSSERRTRNSYYPTYIYLLYNANKARTLARPKRTHVPSFPSSIATQYLVQPHLEQKVQEQASHEWLPKALLTMKGPKATGACNELATKFLRPRPDGLIFHAWRRVQTRSCCRSSLDSGADTCASKRAYLIQ